MRFSYLMMLTVTMILGCSRNSNQGGLNEEEQGKNIFLFIDGTGQDRKEHSNISKLLKNLKRVDEDNIVQYYPGVGTEGKFLGNAMGVGVSEDIKNAYQYLSSSYEPGDRIYLFGYSRGAYTLRALAGMIHLYGLPSVQKYDESNLKEVTELIYDIYHSERTSVEKKEAFSKATAAWDKERGFQDDFNEGVMIEAMGLFDTIEALALPDYQENFCCPSGKYLDQLCNIKRVYHAISLDDNRARIFTPNLIYCRCLEKECGGQSTPLNNRHEVWFGGSHADIGGNTSSSNITLNWMIDNFAADSIFTNSPYTWNIEAELEDAESSSLLNKVIYKRLNRSITQYAQMYPSQAIPVHKSVIDRIENGIVGYDSEWYKDDYFTACYNVVDAGVEFIPCDNIRVVYDKYFPSE